MKDAVHINPYYGGGHGRIYHGGNGTFFWHSSARDQIFFIIVTLALRNGSGRAVLTCLGIAVANGVYIVLAIIGFSIVREHPWLITLMKISGAVFSVLYRHNAGEVVTADAVSCRRGDRLSGFSTEIIYVRVYVCNTESEKPSVLYDTLFSFLSVHLQLYKYRLPTGCGCSAWCFCGMFSLLIP